MMLAVAVCRLKHNRPNGYAFQVSGDQAQGRRPITHLPLLLSKEVLRHDACCGCLQVKATTGRAGMPFESVVVRPKGDKPLPGVLFPHGGPHSAYSAAYSNLVAFQAAQGYSVVCVNFR